jgi:hypothetical protein
MADIFDFCTRIIIGILVTVLLGLSFPAHSDDNPEDDWEEDPTGNRFGIAFGGFFPKLDTLVRVDSADGGIGTTIDFESTLGMDKSNNLPTVRGYFRFNEKHRINFGYFDLERSGLGVSDVEIRFGDVTFPANLPLNSFFDIEVIDLTYGYTLIHNEKWDLEASVGLSLQKIGIGMQGALVSVLEEEVKVTVPLPTFGFSGIYALTDKLLLGGRLGIFAIELDLDSSNIGGSVIDAQLSLFHQTFKNMGFGIGANYFRVNVDYETDKLNVDAKYDYIGPTIFITAYY